MGSPGVMLCNFTFNLFLGFHIKFVQVAVVMYNLSDPVSWVVQDCTLLYAHFPALPPAHDVDVSSLLLFCNSIENALKELNEPATMPSLQLQPRLKINS